ncbi:metallophosphoesterase [Oceanobacillus piezotolerans]|uniref:Metallophosphoesterase n=1 Tax=Oceanobacillus piezotolerans TaxID=2448030 RepID=A0A498D9E4_9BACI|nr:metallophosphoesterase [Oceanobacillus piezotolerans]RLL47724.1 metallophosphoesterase [Oceanobacillus piezotolerans]
MLTVIILIFVSFLSYHLYKGYRNTKKLIINEITVHEQNASIKPPLRVLQISDMHIENISITPERLYEQLKKEQIDLIALTGDFLDRKRSIPKLVPYLEVFQKLNPAYGSYAVFGNHDYVLRQKNFDKLNTLLMDYGIQTMRNENKKIKVNDQIINIIGIDDFGTEHSDIKNAYRGVAEGYQLVLTHDPNIVLAMEECDYDYLLSGHFHGGQIHWPKPYHLVKMGKLARMNIIKGVQSYKGKSFYISEGIGQTGINIRIGSFPEITIHEIHPQTITKSEIAG